MSIKSQIDRIELNISASFTALEESGISTDYAKTSDNLAAAIRDTINAINEVVDGINGGDASGTGSGGGSSGGSIETCKVTVSGKGFICIGYTTLDADGNIVYETSTEEGTYTVVKNSIVMMEYYGDMSYVDEYDISNGLYTLPYMDDTSATLGSGLVTALISSDKSYTFINAELN